MPTTKRLWIFGIACFIAGVSATLGFHAIANGGSRNTSLPYSGTYRRLESSDGSSRTVTISDDGQIAWFSNAFDPRAAVTGQRVPVTKVSNYGGIISDDAAELKIGDQDWSFDGIHKEQLLHLHDGYYCRVAP